MKLVRVALKPDARLFLMMEVPDDRTPTQMWLAARADGALFAPDFAVPYDSIHHLVTISASIGPQPLWGVPMTMPEGKAN